MDPQDHRRIARRAYKAFVQELTSSLAHARDDMERFAHRPLERDVAKHLAIEFHKIKGGAGFFGLDAVASTAGLLQETFLNAIQSAENEISKAESLLLELEELSRGLPSPEDSDGS